jgi:hypothetical protein
LNALARVLRTPVGHLLRGRAHGETWRSRLDAADLPGPQLETIAKVVKRSRLWRSEKLAVVDELIAHFYDANEAEANDPVASFGDPFTAAKLIRRSKKRNRSLVWQSIKWVRRGFAVVIMLYVALAIRFFWGEPSVNTDYLAKLNASILATPEADRAWPLYREAMLALGMGYKPGEDWSLRRVIFNESGEFIKPGDPGWPGVVEAMQEHAAAIALLREASAKPAMGLPFSHETRPQDAELFPPDPAYAEPSATPQSIDATLIGVLLPALVHFRNVAKVLIEDGYVAIESEDMDRAVSNMIAMVHLADHTAEQPLLINGLVSISINQLAISHAGQWLRLRPQLFSDQQLAKLAHAFANAKGARYIDYAGERAMMYDLVQRMYTDDGQGDGRMTDEGMRMLESISKTGLMEDGNFDDSAMMGLEPLARLSAGPATMLVSASRRELIERYDRWMDQAERELHRPMWQPIENSVDEQIEASAMDFGERLKYPLIHVLMPAVGALRKTTGRYDGQRQGLLVAIALELYRRDHGDYPDASASLSVLTPRYLPEVPLDPASGQPLHWMLRDGQPIVYGFGTDGDDDGGTPASAIDPGVEDRHIFDPPDDTPVDGDWIVYPIDD